MVVTCAVPKCKSYKTKKKNVSMFKVPRDIEMRKKWKAAIPGVVAFKKTHTICEKHFEAHYIIRSYIKHDANGKVIANVPFQRPRLHSSAVPTIFDDNTSSIYNKVDKVPELVHPTESHQSIIGKKCDRFEAWSNALKTKKMTSYMRVCSRHFQKEDYILPDVVSKTRRLKTTAVPSCTLPSSATRKTPSVAEADEARLQKQISKKKYRGLSVRRLSRKKGWVRRRRMLKQMEQRMQVDRDTENNESTDPLKSVELPPDVTTSEINTEMIHCHRIKEEPTDNNEEQIESYNEEGVCNKMKIETEDYKEEGACNETIEYCEDNTDLVSINTVDNTVEKTEGHLSTVVKYGQVYRTHDTFYRLYSLQHSRVKDIQRHNGMRRMLKQMAQRMQVDRDTENTESTDPLNSVKLLSNVTTCEINTEMIHCHQIKEEPTDTNEGQRETYTEEGVCSGNIEYLEDDKSKVNETERYEKEGGCNETTEYCEDNKDLVFINIDKVEKTEGHAKESTHNRSRGHSEAKEDIRINNTCSTNTCSTQEDVPTRRSIVNFSFMWSEIHRTFNTHSRGIACQFKYWNLVNHRRRGLLTEFFFKCDKCHYEASIQSEPERTKTPNINATSITATDAAGIRFFQLKQLLTAMDI
ncbi:hypothetical protein DBV15_05965, partial [Temnothorax longispinosus]